MKTRNSTITIRIPIEVFVQLHDKAQENHTSTSEVARDLIMSGLVEQTGEHVFLSRSEWGNAVRSRDKYRCVRCGSPKDVDAHHIKPVYQGGRNVLSNGETLCYICHKWKHNSDCHLQATDNIQTSIPNKWLAKERSAAQNRNGDTSKFWYEQLALFMTRRKAPWSSVVQQYIDDYLKDIPEDVIIRTLVKLCPTPDIIAKFPRRDKKVAGECFHRPQFEWK